MTEAGFVQGNGLYCISGSGIQRLCRFRAGSRGQTGHHVATGLAYSLRKTYLDLHHSHFPFLGAFLRMNKGLDSPFPFLFLFALITARRTLAQLRPLCSLLFPSLLLHFFFF